MIKKNKNHSITIYNEKDLNEWNNEMNKIRFELDNINRTINMVNRLLSLDLPNEFVEIFARDLLLWLEPLNLNNLKKIKLYCRSRCNIYYML